LSAIAVPRGVAAPPRPAGRTLASGRHLQLAAFAALSVFGALFWAVLLRPAPYGRMLLCVGLALVLLVALERAARLPLRARAVVYGVIVLAFAVAALLAAGVPVRLLGPRNWGDLAGGIGQGIDAMPGISVPYKGVDPWVRIDILADGGLLLGFAAGLMVRSRRRERRPIGAALVVAAMFVVSVVEHNPARPFLWGAVFTVLFGAMLWADRLERAYVPGVAVFLTVAVGAGLFVAPRLDTEDPWLDYQAIVESLSGNSGVRFNWNHGYGPLNWPRHNREMLRVAAKTPAYWKAVDLDRFDGTRWRAAENVAPAPVEIAPNHADWKTKLRVTIRGFKSNAYIAAGTALAIEHSPRFAIASAPGTFATGSEPLQKGDTYEAEVYAPRPSIRELRNAGTNYPDIGGDFLTIDLPESAGGPPGLVGAPSTLPPTKIEFAPFSLLTVRAPPVAYLQDGTVNLDGGALLLNSDYAEMYDLARRLRADAVTPYEYLLEIERRLSRGYAYSETPPKPAAGRPPLMSFLFDSKIGYCQQFSGAMALLLRMGGIPARVASGFTPGSLDRARGEWVVRDVDAHSWVEAYFPQLGWITFDPTPGVAPPRTQLLNEPAPPNAPSNPMRTDQRRADVPGGAGLEGGGAAAEDATVSIWVILLLSGLAGALVGGGALAIRAWRRPEDAPEDLAELVRALRRSGRPVQPPLTLRALEERFRRDAPGAAAYVAAVRMTRFAGRGEGPSDEQRTALRTELGHGLGWSGRLRAWWALPPAWLHGRHRPERVYNEG
jgi:transglutaminase-like putative cysteine protease